MRAPAVAAEPPARRRLLVALAAALLLAQMAAGMMRSAGGDAPTYDEPAHLAAGVAYVVEHDLRFNPEHPPVAKALAALPFLVADLRVPTSSAAYRAADPYGWGNELLFGAGNDPLRTMWLARLPLILLSLVLALVVFGFARDLFGAPAALLAMALVSLCPTVLAHSRLVQTDLTVTTFLVAALWFLWRAAHRRLAWVPVAGLVLGLALASKFTALVLLPVVVALAGWSVWTATAGAGRRRRLLLSAGGAAVVVGLAFATVAAVYLAIDPQLRFDREVATADEAAGVEARVADLLPVPEPYRLGLRYAIRADQLGRTSFLRGETYAGGRRHYYPTVLAMKTPVAALALWLVALVALAGHTRRADVAAFVVAPALALLGFAVVSSTNIGVRHVLLVPVLLAVAAPAVLRWGRPAAVGAGAAVALVAASVWGQHPAYLPYVNEAFGGPDRAYLLVSDSNVDWGQDLRRLASWLERRHPGEEAWLAYFGTVPPAAYRVPAGDALTVPPEQLHGLVAISATLPNSFYPGRFDAVTRGRRPVAQIGHSILVYRVP